MRVFTAKAIARQGIRVRFLTTGEQATVTPANTFRTAKPIVRTFLPIKRFVRGSKIIEGCLASVMTLLLVATIPVTLSMSGPAKAGRPALVVVPPWTGDPARIIAEARGREIGLRAAPMARLAVFENPSLAVAAGAWAVLDAEALASICGFRGS